MAGARTGGMLSMTGAALSANAQAIVAFETPEIACIVLIGNHDREHPPLDVYRQLYEPAGHQPPDQAGRSKPPCCDTESGKPPVDTALSQFKTNSGPFRATTANTSP
ncbi:MAG TPA: hypothetical protein VFQ44_25215 [Streptosporangiaceae bacterium]|nr:hypothetical protein [Streptosporangiaceae bacterium]